MLLVALVATAAAVGWPRHHASPPRDATNAPPSAAASDSVVADAPPPAGASTDVPSRAAAPRARAARTAVAATPAEPAPLSPPPPAAQTEARLASADALAHEADDALRDGRDEDAYGAAEACLRRDPGEVRCLRAAGVALVRTGRLEAARPHVSACLEHDSGDAQCLVAAARLALGDRDLTLAGITIWRLSQVEPNSVETLAARAELSELQGDRAAAERAWRQACRAGAPFACIRLGDLMTSARQ